MRRMLTQQVHLNEVVTVDVAAFDYDYLHPLHRYQDVTFLDWDDYGWSPSTEKVEDANHIFRQSFANVFGSPGIFPFSITADDPPPDVGNDDPVTATAQVEVLSEAAITLTMTSPPGGEIHLAPGSTSVPLSGMAVSNLVTDTVNTVEVAFTDVGAGYPTADTAWAAVTYDPNTHIWSTTWSNPVSKRVWVRARLHLDHNAVIHRDITVSTISDVIYVSPTGDDINNDGTSWAAAKLTVQAGLNTAGDGDEVWVAADTYAEHIQFQSGLGVSLYGGFTGSETYREERNWSANCTVLDGEHSGPVIQWTQGTSSSPATIDGFTICNGRSTNGVGSGIICSGSGGHLTISHNRITGNIGTLSSNDGVGLGIYCSSGPMDITNNFIAENTVQTGCGIAIYCASSLVTIANNTITDNTGTFGFEPGGAVHCNQCSPILVNNIIANNDSGGVRREGELKIPRLTHNCVYNGTGNDYLNLDAPHQAFGNISANPLVSTDGHLQAASPCVNSGDSNAVRYDFRDIDGQARIQRGGIDIGADEAVETSAGCVYAVILSSEDTQIPAGENATPAMVTASVLDGTGNPPPPGCQVDISVDGGWITSVTCYGVPSDLTGMPQSAFGITGSDGKVEIGVRSDHERYVRATATVHACATPVAAKSPGIWFYTTDQGDWPMFMHDPQHTGRSHTVDMTGEASTQMNLAWEAQVKTPVTERLQTWLCHNWVGSDHMFEHPFMDSSPVVVGDRVVVGEWLGGSYAFGAGSVKAFYGTDGDIAWYANTGGNTPPDPPVPLSMGGVASTPCIWDGKVYVGASDGYLYCLSLANGQRLWQSPTEDRSTPSQPSKILASPVVHDGIVYIGNEAAKVYAFNADTGVQEWEVALPIEGHMDEPPPESDCDMEGRMNVTGVSSPAIASIGSNEYLLVGCDDWYIYRITLSAPDPPSTVEGIDLGSCVESSPTVVGNEAYVGTSDPYNYQVSIEPFLTLSRTQGNAECRATLAYGFDGCLYGGLDTGNSFHKWYAGSLDRDTAPFIPTGVGYFVGSAAVCGNGLIYVGNDNGRLYAVDTSNLEQAADYVHDMYLGYTCSSPAIAYNVVSGHRRVYITSRSSDNLLPGDGLLWAFDTVLDNP